MGRGLSGMWGGPVFSAHIKYAGRGALPPLILKYFLLEYPLKSLNL